MSTEDQMRRALQVIFTQAEKAFEVVNLGGDVHKIHAAELDALKHIYSAVITVIGFPGSDRWEGKDG